MKLQTLIFLANASTILAEAKSQLPGSNVTLPEHPERKGGGGGGHAGDGREGGGDAGSGSSGGGAKPAPVVGGGAHSDEGSTLDRGHILGSVAGVVVGTGLMI